MSSLVCGVRWWRRVCVAVAVPVVCVLATSGSAIAASPGPGWAVHVDALPTEFAAAHDAACATAPEQTSESVPCDQYKIVVTNVGSEPSSGPVTISDALSTNVTAVFVDGEAQQPGSNAKVFACTISSVSCTYGQSVQPGGLLIMTVNVSVVPTVEATTTSTVTVQGGGAATVASAESTRLNGPPESFGVNDIAAMAAGVNGAADTQAGDHPYAFTTSIDFNTALSFEADTDEYVHPPVQTPREIAVDLPPGFVGDPQAVAAQCPLHALDIGTGTTDCPKASEVGLITIVSDEGIFDTSNVGIEILKGLSQPVVTPIYDMVPEAGYPAEFGFTYNGHAVYLYASLVRADRGAGGYVLQVRTPGVPGVPLVSASVTFFGDPSERDGEGASAAFFTNPVDCSAGPLRTRVEVDSWEDPKLSPSERTEWPSAEAVTYPQLTGCELLRFEPGIALKPETTTSDTPSGYEVEVSVPQSGDLFPSLATPVLKDASVVLPAGLSVSPSAANGLAGCSDAQIDMESTGVGSCPVGSKVGSVEIVTPLLAEPLKGEVFVGEPECSPCSEADARDGHMLRLFVQACESRAGQVNGCEPGSGVVVKLEGRVSTSSSSGGQLTASFADDPQLPFSKLTMRLDGGERAPLANPQSCGVFAANSDLTPWSTPITPDATPSANVNIEGCGNPVPFAPVFSAGGVSAGAGAFSPFDVSFSRNDGEQGLGAVQVSTPPGLLGMLSKVTPCGEPHAAEGTCGSESLIGHSEVAAGAGKEPFWEPGEVFLTGPYDGAPFGLSVVTQAKAGPFDLGSVVVRAAISVNPETSAITVTSAPFPQILDGVALRIRQVRVAIDREGFMFNPTSCAAHEVTGRIVSAQGAVVGVSSPFTVGGCKGLSFAPSLSASTGGRASKADGADLVVKVASPGLGQADIAKVLLELPKVLPARLATLQKACPQAVFAANPASCDEGSVIGMARIHTPILKSALSGPAYLVSHGGAAFPDVEFVLQGEGVTVILDGKTDIKDGVTYSSFESVPDAPFTSFETVLPTGPHSALTASVAESKDYDLCGEALAMPTTITAQNGMVIEQDTRIAVEDCGAVKAAKAKKLSRAQQLANALKACRREYKRSRAKRVVCEQRARKRYAVRAGKAARTKSGRRVVHKASHSGVVAGMVGSASDKSTRP